MKSVFEDDKYLRPVLDDDALLYSLDDVFEDEASLVPRDEVAELKEQLANLQAQFAAYREEVQSTMLKQLEISEPAERLSDAGPVPSVAGRQHGTSGDHTAEDKEYFKAYSYNSIHETMLKDTVRTETYRDFIYDNKQLFKGKVVLDVGCGTGILSMFCAKAGAALVIAVDNSDIIDKARENVFRNGLQDQIKCLRGKVEEVVLPVAQVDVIVSEWMGYCLLYESMLDSVISARDKYLRSGGLMVPSHVTLRMAPLADSDLKASHIDFWTDIYGFDMTAMLERAHEEVLIRTVDDKELAAESVAILQLDLHQTQVDDLTFSNPFHLKWKEGHRLLEGFVIWFDTFFSTDPNSAAGFGPDASADLAKRQGRVAFSTGPESEPTHWQQGVFLIQDPSDEPAPDDEVRGEVRYHKKSGQQRSLEIDIQWSTSTGRLRSQSWLLE